MTSSESSQNTPTRSAWLGRRFRRLLVLAILGIVVLTFSWLLTKNLQPSYSTVHLTQTSVHPGDRITFEIDMRRQPWRGLDENAISISSDRGQEMVIHDMLDRPAFGKIVEAVQAGLGTHSTSAEQYTWSSLITNETTTLSGFVSVNQYTQVESLANQLATGQASSYQPRLNGCPGGTRFVDRHREVRDFYVLPKTPTGRYVVTVPNVFYCGSPGSTLSFVITIAD